MIHMETYIIYIIITGENQQYTTRVFHMIHMGNIYNVYNYYRWKIIIYNIGCLYVPHGEYIKYI